MPDFHGVLPALITPFTEDGADVDADALAAIVDRLVGAGAGGLVPGGSTGEFTTLSNAERREVIEVTVEAAAGRVPVVAGTGRALHARDGRAQRPRRARRSRRRHGRAAVLRGAELARAARPLHRGGRRDLDPDHVLQPPERLGREADRASSSASCRSRALKDTGGDAVAATELIQAGEDGPTLLNGWDTLTFAALAAGVRAVVWGTASILPEQCVALHRLLIDDIDLPAARDLWARLWPLCHFLESQSYSAAVKAGVRARRRHHRARCARRCWPSTTTPPPSSAVCSSARERAWRPRSYSPSSRGRTRIIGTSSPARVSGYTT